MEESLLKIVPSLGGFAGLVCFLLVYYLGKELRVMREAVDRMTYARLLELAASPHISQEVKAEATKQLKNVEEALEPPRKRGK